MWRIQNGQAYSVEQDAGRFRITIRSVLIWTDSKDDAADLDQFELTGIAAHTRNFINARLHWRVGGIQVGDGHNKNTAITAGDRSGHPRDLERRSACCGLR